MSFAVKMYVFGVIICLSMGLGANGFAFRGIKRLTSSRTLYMADDVTHFEYLVVGGGSGGIASARRAAQYGKKVGLVEASALGGTCVNVGCVPKKVMYNAATVSEILHDAKQFGFDANYTFDWKKLKDMRDAYIQRLNGIYLRNMGNNGVEVIAGYGSFKDSKTVTVNGKDYTADNILIAVGGTPRMPDIPGVEHCINSNGFFLLDNQPKKVAVIGAGYIGVELAGVFQALGTQTEIFTRGDKILRGFDDYIVDELLTEMGKQGLVHHGNASPASVSKNADGSLNLKTTSGESYGPFDEILFATGRKPLVEKLGLDAAGIKTDNKGYIEADSFQETSAEGVYALGDVCGKIELTPMAIAAGRKLADRLFNGEKDARADYSNVPTVVFSHPVIGVVGLTEADAVAKYGEDRIKIYTSRFTNLWYGPWQMEPEDKPKTSYKIVTLLPEEKVIGIHMIGMASDEVLQGFGVAMKMGATKADFDSCIAIHPTAAEELVTLAPWKGKNPTN
jgi:glutathione reductase (NADPH)